MIDRVELWVCDECGYFRIDKSTGVHQTNNPDDWRGKMVVHNLKPVSFVRVETEDE